MRNCMFSGVESGRHLERRKSGFMKPAEMCGPKSKKETFDYQLSGNFKSARSNAQRIELAGGSVAQKGIVLTAWPV